MAESPVRIETTLNRPFLLAGTETSDPIYALIRLQPDDGGAVRPRLDVCFLIDASASMYHFRMDAATRASWIQIARQRGEAVEQVVEGRRALVWTGQTMRELSEQVSTPMYCALRGLWRGLRSLEPDDSLAVLAFADQATLFLDDTGQPDLAARLPLTQRALEPLAAGAGQSGMGFNTRLAQALQLACERVDRHAGSAVIHRAILVSDGQIEDRADCLHLLEEAIDRGLVISTIGVGEEFDEEFLMRIADETRGRYAYAPTAKDLEAALVNEVTSLSMAVARQAALRVEPSPEVVFQGLYQTGPDLALFPIQWVDEGRTIYQLGSVPGTTELQLLAAFAVPAFQGESARLADLHLMGLAVTNDEVVHADATLAASLTDQEPVAAHREDAVLDVVSRLEVYLEERRAAAARERGDVATTTRHLQAATRMLRRLGNEALAGQMEAEAAALATGTEDRARTKRIKAGTRKLSGPAA